MFWTRVSILCNGIHQGVRSRATFATSACTSHVRGQGRHQDAVRESTTTIVRALVLDPIHTRGFIINPARIREVTRDRIHAVQVHKLGDS